MVWGSDETKAKKLGSDFGMSEKRSESDVYVCCIEKEEAAGKIDDKAWVQRANR